MLFMLFLRVIIYGSILMLWFFGAYAVFDWMGVGKVRVNTTNTAVENIIAGFANDDLVEFSKELSQVLPPAKSIIGDIDFLRRLPDGRLQLRGWAGDNDDPKHPVSIFLIIPKKAVLMTSASMERGGLPIKSLVAGFDAVFNYQFDCKTNKQNHFIMVINEKKQFSVINRGIPIGGC